VQNYPKSSNVYTLGERKGCSSRQSALTSRQYFATHKQSPTDRADLKASLGKLNKKPRVVYNNVHWEQMGFWTSQQRSYSKRRRLDNPILTYYLHLNVVLLFTIYPMQPHATRGLTSLRVNHEHVTLLTPAHLQRPHRLLYIGFSVVPFCCCVSIFYTLYTTMYYYANEIPRAKHGSTTCKG